MLNYLLGRSEFQGKKKIIDSVRNFERFDDSEVLDKADALLIFKNSTQQCWFVFTNLRMYFVIDDVEQNYLKAQWARDRENLIEDGRVNLHLKEESYTRETGMLFFGNMNNKVFFTRSLFHEESIASKVLSLANKHFLYPNHRTSSS